jgi:hypothetical protein
MPNIIPTRAENVNDNITGNIVNITGILEIKLKIRAPIIPVNIPITPPINDNTRASERN